MCDHPNLIVNVKTSSTTVFRTRQAVSRDIGNAEIVVKCADCSASMTFAMDDGFRGVTIGDFPFIAAKRFYALDESRRDGIRLSIERLELAVSMNETTLQESAQLMTPAERDHYQRTIARQHEEIAGFQRML